MNDLATLVRLDPAALVAWGKERLEAAGTGLEVRKVKATAAAIAAYQRAVGAGKDAQQAAVEVTVRCERRLQQELKKLEKNKGARGNPGGRGAAIVRSGDGTAQPTLADLGVDKRRAHENAVLAEVTPEQFEAGITALRERGELTQGAMLNLMGQAMAGGLSPDELEASIMAEKARRPKPEPLRLRDDIDLSPVATAIFDLEGSNLWGFDPLACAATVTPLLRARLLRRARECRGWLDRFIGAVEQQPEKGGQHGPAGEKPGREAA